MQQNQSAPTGATLDKLVRFCNGFFETNTLQFLWNDLVWWLSGKPNPNYFPRVDLRRTRVCAAFIPILKGLFKLYKIGPTGRFIHEKQFREGFWIHTTIDQVLKFCGRSVSYSQWLYVRKALAQTGILKIRMVTRREDGSDIYLQIDFARLNDILEQLPELRKQIPGIDNWPLPSLTISRPELYLSPNSQSIATPPTHETVGLGLRPTSSAPSRDSGNRQSTQKEISASPEESQFEKVAFADEVFQGTLDIEGEMIRQMLFNIFQKPITNSQVHKLNALRHRKPRHGKMTLSRASRFRDLQGMSAFPDWVNNLTLDKLLYPPFWLTIVREMDKINHLPAQEDADFLETALGYETSVEAALQVLRDAPDSYWEALVDFERQSYNRNWPMMALYGLRKGWVPAVIEVILRKAKTALMATPIFFSRTDHIAKWSVLLNLTAKETDNLHHQADNKFRTMQWRVFQAEQAGAL